VAGGVMVSLFALLGSAFRPKTFAGTFGAAPSVALATLTLAFRNEGPSYAASECRSMIAGAVALMAYGLACAALTRRRGVPVWLAAVACWFVWLAVAFGLLLGGAVPS
jgi:hypothetical protein